MKKPTTLTAVVPAANIEEASQEVGASLERFCLTAGLATLSSMMEEDAVALIPHAAERYSGRMRRESPCLEELGRQSKNRHAPRIFHYGGQSSDKRLPWSSPRNSISTSPLPLMS